MKWDIWSSVQHDPSQIEAEARKRAGSDLVAAVLWARGIQSGDEVEAFFTSSSAPLHDPMQMAGMAEGAARIRAAIERGETVAVYGDYDADGVTASALMADYLHSKGLSCSVYIPDRLEEGYGLNLAALEELAAAGVTLIVTVDCGVTAITEVEAAKAFGLDMVITDHHECQGTELPDAVAVIDPKRPDCAYLDKSLAGVGVAFQVISAVEGPGQEKALLARYSDLVAIGTVADVMDLRGENRVFVSEGIRALQTGKRPGLLALMKEAKLDPAVVQATDIGYLIAPRLNAAGRMGNAMLAFSLLDTRDKDEAAALAEALTELNQQRQKVEQAILDDLAEMLDDRGYTSGPIVLHSARWHKGVLGVVASRLKERYQEPVILLQVEGEVGQGSCRSVEGFDLMAALEACRDSIERCGGHQQAAGLTLPMSELERFESAFAAYYQDHPPHTGGRTLLADFTVTEPKLLALEQIESLERLEPCGKGFPQPTLVMEGATLVRCFPIGGGKHLKLQVEKWGQVYDGVFFGTTLQTLGANEGDVVDLAFTPQINSFRGKTTVQFLLSDLARTDERLTGRAKRLCTELLDGQLPTVEEARRFCPGREDFVSLWLRLRKEGREIKGQLHRVLEILSRDLSGRSPAKAYLCLKVLDELGLAQVEEQADTVHIKLAEQAEKVDLNASRMLSALTSVMG
ncbi:MAG: single-stranded-DNA-specific exonuclease RecJ [Oscillospiraceae bacterium]|nr:single-stranded-DNA-specific exonuclease RecJ [Oscillospiraceae bacterium]